MPIPSPTAGESQADFLERGHHALAHEFPDTDQRNAVLFKQWRKSKGVTEEEKKAHERFGDKEYQHLQDIPVFKEHAYVRNIRGRDGSPLLDDDGNPKQRIEHYDLKALKAIVANCNRRILETKSFAPITAMHTGKRKLDGTLEQPEIMGFAGPYRLGMYGNEERDDGSGLKGRWAIYNDEFWFKDKAHRAREMPRRSPEVYVGRPIEDRFLDPITALGAETPALDMGIHYSMGKQGQLIECYSAPNITVTDYSGKFVATYAQAGDEFDKDLSAKARKASALAHDQSKKTNVYKVGGDVKKFLDEFHRTGREAHDFASHAKAAEGHYHAQELHHFHTNEGGEGGPEGAALHDAARVAHWNAYKAHKRASGFTDLTNTSPDKNLYQAVAAAMPGPANVSPPKEVGNKVQYDEEAVKDWHDFHMQAAASHRELAKNAKNPDKHIRFAKWHEQQAEGHMGKLDLSTIPLQGDELRQNFAAAFAEVLIDKYEADPETINACVNAMLETQPIQRILAFLDSNDAPVNTQQKMMQEQGLMAQQTGMQQLDPTQPKPEGEHSPAPGESPPEEGEEGAVGPNGEQNGDEGLPDPDTEKEKPMADGKGTAAAPPAPGGADDKKDRFELQEFLRNQKVWQDDMTAKYEAQQAEIEDLRGKNARLTGERNLAVRTQKVMDLRRTYVFSPEDFLTRYAQGSEGEFQNAMDFVTNNCERVPAGASLFIPALDLPPGAEQEKEKLSQMGGGTEADAAEVAQYALDHLQETGEHMSYDEARAKLGKKAAKKARKEAAAS